MANALAVSAIIFSKTTIFFIFVELTTIMSSQ